MAFSILTDAGANFIGNAVSRYRVPGVCLPLVTGGKTYRSINTGNQRELTELYRAIGKGNAATDVPTQESYQKLFEPTLQEGRDVLYVGLSSTLSDTYYVALNAANALRERYQNRKIYCFNSLSASMGQGILVQYACMLKERGADLLQTYEALAEKRRRVKHLFTVAEPLKLMQNKRLERLNYNPDSSFNVRPVIAIDACGKLKPVSRAHGKTRTVAELARAVAADIVDPAGQTVYIAHANCAEDAWALREQIARRVPCKKIIADYLDPALAAHTGTGALGVFYLGDTRG
jgi:DegV family protein with EDD domain